MRFPLIPPLLLAAAIPAIASCTAGEADAPRNDPAPDAKAQRAANEAAPANDPDLADMTRAIYAMYADIDAVEMTNPPLPMTEELADLFAAERDASAASGGEPVHLDFAWVIGGAQDYELGPVTVTEEPIEPGMTMLVADFTNLGEPQKVRYVLVSQDDDWLLDDIVVEGPGDNATSVADQLRGF